MEKQEEKPKKEKVQRPKFKSHTVVEKLINKNNDPRASDLKNDKNFDLIE